VVVGIALPTEPPSCTRTPMAWMPMACSRGTQVLTAWASSMKWTSPMPVGETMVGVVRVTTPIMAIFWFAGVVNTWYGGSIGSSVSFEITLAAR
jgi:hypothetical protein